MKLYLLSKCIPDCYKLSKTGCDEQNMEMEEQMKAKDGIAWSQGLAWKEGEQIKAGKNEINLLNTFIELLTITKHNV